AERSQALRARRRGAPRIQPGTHRRSHIPAGLGRRGTRLRSRCRGAASPRSTGTRSGPNRRALFSNARPRSRRHPRGSPPDPAAVGLIVLGYPIVALLLERGAFDANATWATSFALAWYAVGLPGHAMVEIVDRVFYAQHDTASPLRVAAVGATVNIVLSLILM